MFLLSVRSVTCEKKKKKQHQEDDDIVSSIALFLSLSASHYQSYNSTSVTARQSTSKDTFECRHTHTHIHTAVTIPHHALDVAVPETTSSSSAGSSPKLTVSPQFKAFRHSIYASGTKHQRRSASPELSSPSRGNDSNNDSNNNNKMASSSSGSVPPRKPPPPAASSSSSSVSAKATSDPILRNTLRYTISAREYALLHKYVLSRNRQVKKRVPSIEMVNRIMNGGGGDVVASSSSASSNKRKDKGKQLPASSDLDVADVASTSAGLDAGAGAMLGADDFNARAVRHSLRVFGVTAVAMKLYGLAMQRFGGMKPE